MQSDEYSPHQQGYDDVVDSSVEPYAVENKPYNHRYRQCIEECKCVKHICLKGYHIKHNEGNGSNQPHKENTHTCNEKVILLSVQISQLHT